MTDTETKRHAVTQVTWCMTHNAYAEDRCGDDHDHYDVVLDEVGKVLFRVWPVGTTWRTAEGYTMRLRRYDRAIVDMFAAEDRGEDGRAVPARPVFDGVAPSGGAFGDSEWLPGPGDVIVEFVLGDARPAPGALFIRPHGEAWRLRDYGTNWKAEPFTGKHDLPSWSVANLDGSQSSGAGRDLPEDARLVWHP